jgi:hypothetical protein
MEDFFEDEDQINEGDEYEEYEEYDNEPEMRAEMGAFGPGGRVGGSSSILGSKIDPRELKGKKMSEIAKKLSRISMTPNERLRIYVDALSRKLNDDEVLKITDNMIEHMLTYISNLKNPENINPIGFILGYIATDGGKNMNKTQVKNVIKIVKKLDDEGGITDPDVIRYSRLWLNLREF